MEGRIHSRSPLGPVWQPWQGTSNGSRQSAIEEPPPDFLLTACDRGPEAMHPVNDPHSVAVDEDWRKFNLSLSQPAGVVFVFSSKPR